MGIDNQSIGSDWRGWGMRMGVVSMMAATGMVLAGHAAAATPMVTQPSDGPETLIPPSTVSTESTVSSGSPILVTSATYDIITILFPRGTFNKDAN